MERTNPSFQASYPRWKEILWGMLRAFIGSFVPALGFMLTSVTIENFESKETLIKLVVSLTIGACTAGIVGLGKYMRTLFPDSEIVSKLPF